MLNPDRCCFPNYGGMGAKSVHRWGRMSCQLQWGWDSRNLAYRLYSFDNGQQVHARPNPSKADPRTGKLMKQMPTHRFPSTATPSFYVPKPDIKTEDDVV